MNKKYAFGIMALATVATLVAAVPALAETNGSKNDQNGNGQYNQNRGPGMMKPFIVGTVSAVNGNTITVLSAGRTGFGAGKATTTATTTYTVNATNAKVTKANATSTVASIAVGDTVAVQGTVTGTNVVATMIRDGVAGGPGMGFGFGRGNEKGGPNDPNKIGTSTPAFTGNGQPIVAGKITAISSSTITIANSSNVTYTVDATNAKILRSNVTSSVSALQVGDTVLVQGTVNGTSITATTVIDQTKPANSGNNPHPGFFGGIGQFFMHLFGF